MSEKEQQHQHNNEGQSQRRRRRPRRRKKPQGPPIQVEGYLWVRDNGSPLLVSPVRNFVPDRNDPTVPGELLNPLHLESGLLLTGQAVSGDRPRMSEIETIEGLEPDDYRSKALPFTELVSIDPIERFELETDPEIVEPRVAQLVAPLGMGQRCLIVSPPTAGKTTLLQQMAHG
ncbi:MAG: hypothetical protein MUP13_14745, partial [Thermoanaerobaculales bacterium]|nr:hypothetical protein [Thermoanaerobaculales bacterium]